MRKPNVAIFICLTMTSCMVGPDYTPPEFYGDKVIAQELKLQKKHQIPQNWYALFGDEQLNCLIEYGLKNNTDIDVAVARLKQARASLNISKAGFLPLVNVQGGYDYQKNSKNIGPTADVDYYMAGFDAVWEVDLWGKGRRQDEAASAQLKSEEYSLANVKSVVTAELALNYISLKLAVEKQKLAEQNARLQKNIYNMVKAKYESGLADDIAYNQAAYLLSSTEAQIPFYQGEIEQYKNALAVLSGVLPSQLPLDVNKRSPIFTNNYIYKTEALYNLPSYIIRLRPDVAAAEQNLVAENALIGAATADLYPDVKISALWDYAATGGHQLFNSKSQSYGYKPQAVLPLLDWNRLQNQVEKQKQVKNEALAQYKKTVLSALAELKNAMVWVESELKSNQSQKRALANTIKVVHSTEERYRNGLISFSEVLTAEQNKLSAQNNTLSSQAKIFQNLVAYYKACGGGYLL